MEEKHNCPVCGEFEFSETDSYETCEVCGWEDDALQEKNPDYKGGANLMSLNEAKTAYQDGNPIY